ncbi:MAG: hypothetical protein OXE42_13345 [Gammaproteobacteria bacterium]|nr:hypothetical protein [Gammaproteobacteria bacterium]
MERIGVTLSSVVTLLPSGTERTISSARTVSESMNVCASGNSLSETSRPSARRHVSTSSRSSAERPGIRSMSASRLASRLNDTSLPVLASNTATATGDVSTRASRSARACRSSRCVRALAMAVAACDANKTSTSSASSVNACPSSFSPR